MSIESELRSVLIGDTSLAGLVAARVYPVQLPQAPTYPSLTISKISAIRFPHLTGASGLVQARFSVTCWGATVTASLALADVVRNILNGRNALLATIWAEIKLDNERDLSEFEADLSGLFPIQQDYIVTYKE